MHETERILRSLTEKTDHINAVQHSGRTVQPTDWSDLFHLTHEATAILATIDENASIAQAKVREVIPMTYRQRVQQYEDEGMTTSDAQAVCDAEDLKIQRIQDTAPELLKALKKITNIAMTSPQTLLTLIHNQKDLIAKAEGRTF